MEAADAFDAASTWVGYLGAALLMIAYLLNQAGRLRSDDWRFPAMNFLGSSCIVVALVYHPNLPAFVIEIFWSLISIYGVWKSLRAAAKPRL